MQRASQFRLSSPPGLTAGVGARTPLISDSDTKGCNNSLGFPYCGPSDASVRAVSDEDLRGTIYPDGQFHCSGSMISNLFPPGVNSGTVDLRDFSNVSACDSPGDQILAFSSERHLATGIEQ